MRAILLLTCVVLVMVLLGWLTFANFGNRATIQIETDRIKHDTQQAIDRGEKALQDMGRKTDNLLKQPRSE